jgi:hypothetical protein
LFVLAGEDGFTHLEFEVVLFLHTGPLIVTRPPVETRLAASQPPSPPQPT